MHRLGLPPFVGVDFPDRPERAGHPGVVDQQVDRAEQFLDLVDRVVDRGGVGDVATHTDRLAAGGANAVGNFVELDQRARQQRDVGPLGREPLGDSLSEIRVLHL